MVCQKNLLCRRRYSDYLQINSPYWYLMLHKYVYLWLRLLFLVVNSCFLDELEGMKEICIEDSYQCHLQGDDLVKI